MRFGGLLGTDVNFAGNSDCFLPAETKAKSMSLKATIVRNGLVRKDAHQVRANLLERAIDKFSQESNLSRCLSIDISLPSVAKKRVSISKLCSLTEGVKTPVVFNTRCFRTKRFAEIGFVQTSGNLHSTTQVHFCDGETEHSKF